MRRELLLPFLLVMTASAAEVAPKPMPAKVVEQQLEESYSLKLLNTAKQARSKLQLKQDASAELKTIISTKKTIETSICPVSPMVRGDIAESFGKNRARRK